MIDGQRARQFGQFSSKKYKSTALPRSDSAEMGSLLTQVVGNSTVAGASSSSSASCFSGESCAPAGRTSATEATAHVMAVAASIRQAQRQAQDFTTAFI